MKNKVRILGNGVPYLDGAEDRLLTIMQKASDRSVGSDELATEICDWPTQYHLSRARANLLMPFQIESGKKVLDVGCGTGALTRQFAEWGCNVVGLEGSYERCLVAAERVREFDNVEIVFGSLEEYVNESKDGKFDVVLLCGVLEYSGDGTGGLAGHKEMLNTIKNLLNNDGLLILAIENQIGLKYLFGYNEDHLSKPLVGLQDYLTEKTGIRTWSKSKLQSILNESGYTHQKWFAPFPDYKIPDLVASEDLWTKPNGRQLAKLFIRKPIWDYSNQPSFDVDNLSIFHKFQEIERPFEFSNSFLIAASFSEKSLKNYISPGLLWSGINERLQKFGRKKVIDWIDNKFTLENISNKIVAELQETIVNNPTPREVIIGENLEDWMIEQIRGKSLEESVGIFAVWWGLVIRELQASPMEFDYLPRNFVKDHKEEWHFIDNEWKLSNKISPEIIFLRGLYYLFSERLLVLGLPYYDEELTFSEVAKYLATELDLFVSDSIISDAISFFASISSVVTGRDSSIYQVPIEKFFKNKISHSKLRFQPLFTRVENYNLAREREALINERNQLWEKISDQENRIKSILDSKSWKIVRILRLFARPSVILNKLKS